MSVDWIDLIKWFISYVLLTNFFKWQTNKTNMKKLFAETVSKSRMEWINCFRNEICNSHTYTHPQSFVYEFLHEHKCSFLWDKSLRVQYLDVMVSPFLVFR